MLKRFQSLLLNKDDYEKTEISQIQQQRLVNRVACEQYQLHQQEEEKISEKKKIDIDHHVQKGIEYHELDELEKATHQFRIAAKEESPIGMLLYGLSLRHGWGCRVNSTLAFQYLQKAAEYAVDGLQKGSSSCYNNENTKNKMDTLLATRKGELVIAIYELGVALQQGWGTTRSPETAFYYFKVAAQLGDADAQNEVADCYYRGYGTKKDLYQAATYYRLAASQGRGLIGNSWIYKSKYDNNNNTNNNNNNANTNININNNKNNKNS
ncbi:hypothetical protein INT45_010887 [Circinella minor]|uniref:HCP-like protein n=1 Tax=Circinella minor TaxID=1195481 RepID=A0A8H7SBE3_9FUNG|nr:hypothetical protein INT45_010887 [Circinella minor]